MWRRGAGDVPASVIGPLPAGLHWPAPKQSSTSGLPIKCGGVARRLATKDAAGITAGRMTYDLRRPRLHGLIPQRYRSTDTVPGDAALRRSYQQLERAMDAWCAAAHLAD